MKQIVFAVALYSLALLSNCNSTVTNQNNDNKLIPAPSPEIVAGDNKSYTPRNADKPEQVLIYCDLTTSIKQEGIIKISEKLKRVLLALPRNSVVNIRLVEKNLLIDSPFHELQTPATCNMPETEVERKKLEFQEECKKRDEPYVKEVEKISAKMITLKPKEDISCIMDTFESANDFFIGKNKEKYNFRLIYFSDMIEQCNTNSIYICGSKNQPKKADILAKIENSFTPNYNLAALVGKNLSLIITTSDNFNYKCLSLSEQKDIWTLIFTKTGYINLDVTTFNYTQEIPDTLKGSEINSMNNRIERLIAILSGLITILTAILSVDIKESSKFNFIIDFSALSNTLQNSDPVMKFIVFLISEAANAYFFGMIFNWLHRRFKRKIHDLILFFVVIVLTASISVLFVKAIIFNNGLLTIRDIVGLSFFYFISLVITLIFFCYELAVDETQSPKGSVEELLGKIGGAMKTSILFLIVLYIFFYLLVLFYYISS